jgi:hypothetical protein
MRKHDTQLKVVGKHMYKFSPSQETIERNPDYMGEEYVTAVEPIRNQPNGTRFVAYPQGMTVGKLPDDAKIERRGNKIGRLIPTYSNREWQVSLGRGRFAIVKPEDLIKDIGRDKPPTAHQLAILKEIAAGRNQWRHFKALRHWGTGPYSSGDNQTLGNLLYSMMPEEYKTKRITQNALLKKKFLHKPNEPQHSRPWGHHGWIERHGKPRNYHYTLTEKGRAALKAALAEK